MGSSVRVRIWLIAAAALAADQVAAQSSVHEDFICTSTSTRRVVSVYNGRTFNGEHHSGACRVDYTRNQMTSTLWSSKSDPAYCTAKAATLITKLVKGNFSCKTQGPPANPP